METIEILNELIERYPALGGCREDILRVFETIESTFRAGGRLFCCGSGGSCADSEHIVGELLKSFRIKRSIPDEVKSALGAFGEDGERLAQTLEGALPAISLSSHPAFSTAFSNDSDGIMTCAQQLSGLSRRGDTLLAISTSGNSKSAYYAALLAKASGVRVTALTGAGGGKLKELSDAIVCVPETEVFKVQELHEPVYHAICAMLENEFFG